MHISCDLMTMTDTDDVEKCSKDCRYDIVRNEETVSTGRSQDVGVPYAARVIYPKLLKLRDPNDETPVEALVAT